MLVAQQSTSARGGIQLHASQLARESSHNLELQANVRRTVRHRAQSCLLTYMYMFQTCNTHISCSINLSAA